MAGTRRRKIVVVTGTGSGCGKTTLICRILGAIPRLGAVKVSPREAEGAWAAWGPARQDGGKDTDRYRLAGAQDVALVAGSPHVLPGILKHVVKGMRRTCSGIVIEGSSGLRLDGEILHILVMGAAVNAKGSSQFGFADRRSGKWRTILSTNGRFFTLEWCGNPTSSETRFCVLNNGALGDPEGLVRLVRAFFTSRNG